MGNPTVTPLVETFHDGGFIVSPVAGHYNVDQVSLTGGVKVLAGTVLGAASAGSAATALALGTNVGNGTFGPVTTQAFPETIAGVYSILLTSPTAYTVTAPDGATALGTTGVAFSALGIGFTITAGGTAFVAGDTFTVTATATPGNPTVVSAAGSNTGNGTLGTLTAAGYAARPGVYAIELDSATGYVVSDPTGQEIGHGNTGAVFKAGGLSFTLTAGGTPFAASDSFTITVAPGTGKFKPWDPANVDGSQNVGGILVYTKDVTLADKNATVWVRLGEVNASELLWPAGANAAVIALGLAGLRAIGIIPR